MFAMEHYDVEPDLVCWRMGLRGVHCPQLSDGNQSWMQPTPALLDAPTRAILSLVPRPWAVLDVIAYRKIDRSRHVIGNRLKSRLETIQRRYDC
jgi:4-aminobutyrate aminotransferase-like enzyme